MADKSLKKRNLILDCAEKVFSQKGFSVVTMKDIIEACNISRGGIYLYFSSTDEIFMEVIKSHHQTYLKKTQHNIDEVKDFQVIVETYFENLKQEMLNIKGSLKLAMVEFFITHKTDTESEFFISAMNGLKAPISEILLLGKKQGKISYDNLSDAADLVFYWQIGLEEIMLFYKCTNGKLIFTNRLNEELDFIRTFRLGVILMKEILERRSIRKYENKALSLDLLNKIISAALKAPSAKNRQPWRFIVLVSEEKDKFVQVMRQGIERERVTKVLLPNSSNYISAAKHTAAIIEQAPVLIVVCNPSGHSLYEDLTPEEKIYERADMQSIGAAIQNMLLEATSLGIGTLWICDTYFAYDDLKDYFCDKGEIIAAVALGYPAEHPSERPRKDFDEVVEFQ